MVSKEAMELVKEAVGINHAHLKYISEEEIKAMAACIDTALTKARLEVAKAMQAKCADVIEDLDGNTYADHLRALDPQQVINERMGK